MLGQSPTHLRACASHDPLWSESRGMIVSDPTFGPWGLAERDHHHVLPRTYAAHSCLEKSRSPHRVASVVLRSVHGGIPYVPCCLPQ